MLSRRQFLDSGARNAAGVAAVGVGALALSETTQAAQPQKIRVGVIGVRNRGAVLATQMAALPQGEVVVVCDVDQNQFSQVVSKVSEAQDTAPETETDYRRLLERNDLDVIVVATPDHWHLKMATEVLQSGKDLYLEVPVTRTREEAVQLMQLRQQFPERVIQTGLTQRSAPHFQSAVAAVHSGAIGHVPLAKAWTTHSRRSIGKMKSQPIPPGIDYSAWLGDSGEVPFQANRFHYNWRWFWEYGSGELGNWGVHLLDTALWGLELTEPLRVSSVGGKFHFQDDQETPDTQQVFYDFGDKTITWEHRQWSHQANEGRSAGVAFYGDKGTLIVDRGGWKIYGQKQGDSQEGRDATELHCENFLNSVISRDATNAPLEVASLASNLCHWGNQAHSERREIILAAEKDT